LSPDLGHDILIHRFFPGIDFLSDNYFVIESFLEDCPDRLAAILVSPDLDEIVDSTQLDIVKRKRNRCREIE
jgi:hypothetical protein